MMNEFFEKLEQNPYEDLAWNIPERKQGKAQVIGGNAQSFQTVVRTAEFLAGHYPLESVGVVLPETLRAKVPNLANFQFLPATENGAFNGEGMTAALNGADYNLLVGDLSKNVVTGRELAKVLAEVEKPVLVTRDAVDLLAEQALEKVLLNGQIDFLASAKQVQKLLRAVYYPKMMTLSQPLTQIVEILHKFTLSYPTGIVTLHNEQILVAKQGRVVGVALAKTEYSPLTLWGGELAARMVALNLYNPRRFVEASVAVL